MLVLEVVLRCPNFLPPRGANLLIQGGNSHQVAVSTFPSDGQQRYVLSILTT